jgi:outer membrane protein assembly factor BamA
MKRRLALVSVALFVHSALSLSQTAPAPTTAGTSAADFVVSDIKIEGLQRVSEGTV